MTKGIRKQRLTIELENVSAVNQKAGNRERRRSIFDCQNYLSRNIQIADFFKLRIILFVYTLTGNKNYTTIFCQIYTIIGEIFVRYSFFFDYIVSGFMCLRGSVVSVFANCVSVCVCVCVHES